MERVCSDCQQSFELNTDNFYRCGKWFQIRCKKCAREKVKSYVKIISNETKAARAAYRKAHECRDRAYQLRYRYKVDISFIQDLMNLQKGCCKVCNDSLVTPESTQSYHIDHDHCTGIVRGLLCHNCNVALGLLREDKNIIGNLLSYMESNSL